MTATCSSLASIPSTPCQNRRRKFETYQPDNVAHNIYLTDLFALFSTHGVTDGEGEAVLLAEEFGVARVAAVDGPLDILLQAGHPVEDDVAGGVALEGVFPDHVPGL